MHQRWLTFIVFAFLSVMVFVFFWQQNQPIPIPVYEPSVTVGSISEPTITFINPQKGAKDPRVTIVAFGDFECGPCATLATSLTIVMKTYPNDVRLVWKNLPNESIHPLAIPAATAAHCADRQGNFWLYHDALFARQSALSESQFSQIAQEIGLEMETFQACYDSKDTLPLVQKDFDEGLALGLTSTPTLFIEDEILIGAVSTQELLNVIKRILSSN